MEYYREPFTSEEADLLSRFFTNVDQPVFGLINLPEVVKGALFARYSRTHKSVRRLFLDEFVGDPDTGIDTIASRLGDTDPLVNLRRAEQLYDRVFLEYGDDSVAQLGGAHLAAEQASNVLTKVLEWGRLAAYLEQSTRYIYYDRKLGDRYRYMIPPEVDSAGLGQEYRRYMDGLFSTYSELVGLMKAHFESRFPPSDEDPPAAWRATIRAKACDTIRGLLPAATLSNVGIYGTGQAYEMAIMRMQAHPTEEVQAYGALMLAELRKMIPSFLKRADLPDRGQKWSAYLKDVSHRLGEQAASLSASPEPRDLVTLVDWDPEAETKIAAAALYAVTELPDDQLLELVSAMSSDERARIVAAAVGMRSNRRHKPGRAMERTAYRFDILCDYGAFRDLQRHRMLTLEWQRLTTRFGYETPQELGELGIDGPWHRAMEEGAQLYERMRFTLGPDVAQYVVPFGYRIRFMMEMNPREAFHLIELRSQPAGHPGYRRVAQEMHRAIGEVAGHTLIADAMTYVDYSGVELERLESEKRIEAKRRSSQP